MNYDTVIPESDASRSPFPSHGEIICGVEMIIQKVEDMNSFPLIKFLDAVDKKGVVVERFQMGYRVCADL